MQAKGIETERAFSLELIADTTVDAAYMTRMKANAMRLVPALVLHVNTDGKFVMRVQFGKLKAATGYVLDH